MFRKILSYLVVATIVTPAAVSPAVAGCCGAHPVDNGTMVATQAVYGSGLTTTDTVTNTSMQMVVSEDAVFVPSDSAPDVGAPDSSGATCSGEVM